MKDYVFILNGKYHTTVAVPAHQLTVMLHILEEDDSDVWFYRMRIILGKNSWYIFLADTKG